MSELGETGKLKLPIKEKKPVEQSTPHNENKEPVKLDLSNFGKLDEPIRKLDLTQKKEEVKEEVVETPEEEIKKEEVVEKIQAEQPKAEENDKVEEPASSDKDSVIELIDDSKEDTQEDVKKEVKAEETKVEEVDNPYADIEGLDKLAAFIKETGGSIEDYVRVNADYSNADSSLLLKEYYKSTQPHLDDEDIAFKIEEFSFDEDIDDERDIKRKKLQFKEEVSKAKQHLEGLKSKYYEEVKLGSKLTPEQKEAVEFYNSHKEQSKAVEASRMDFSKKTESLFNEDFKGFEVQVGENKYLYRVNDVASVKEKQSDFNNVFGQYFDEKSGALKDAKGYHKSLFMAQNADSLAEHFYNQGRADMSKEMDAEAKNLNMNGRKDHSSDIKVKGATVRAVSGTDSNKLKIKFKPRG